MSIFFFGTDGCLGGMKRPATDFVKVIATGFGVGVVFSFEGSMIFSGTTYTGVGFLLSVFLTLFEGGGEDVPPTCLDFLIKCSGGSEVKSSNSEDSMILGWLLECNASLSGMYSPPSRSTAVISSCVDIMFVHLY